MRFARVFAVISTVAAVGLLTACPKKKKPIPTPTPTPVALETGTPEPTPGPLPCEMMTVYFDFDKADLKRSARQDLRKLAECILMHRETPGLPFLVVRLAGHADERGSTDYNLALGERRAQSVKEYLTNLGVDSSQLATISYGEERPATQGTNESAWAENRRVEFER